jgi:hypothetical protein
MGGAVRAQTVGAKEWDREIHTDMMSAPWRRLCSWPGILLAENETRFNDGEKTHAPLIDFP